MFTMKDEAKPKQEYVCEKCHTYATEMILDNPKTSCKTIDGVMEITYVGRCPKCGKEYSFEERFKYLGIQLNGTKEEGGE